MNYNISRGIKHPQLPQETIVLVVVQVVESSPQSLALSLPNLELPPLNIFSWVFCIVLGVRSLGCFSSSTIKQLILAGQKTSQRAGKNGYRLFEK